MDNQIPDKDYVYNALLRYNYLPIGKKYPDDIPSNVFSTEDLTPEVADEMIVKYEHTKRNKGFDQIEYRTTRFNNITRLMHIPHPLPYVRLCKCISENWDKDQLIRICQNRNSLLKPAIHDNGRLIMGEYEYLEQISMMDSEKFPDLRFKLEISTGKFYRVKADISSFFPSIYTHSIPWALVGEKKAKKSKLNSDKWYDKLDQAQRDLKKAESQGVPVGPATSNIISEIILYKVDKVLRKNGYCQFTRYVDDYECYCENQEQVDDFILRLEQELRKYLLDLNPQKVLIEKLPLGFQDQWTMTLRNSLPSIRKPSPRDIMNFLDSAVDLQKRYPDGSILKYAARALANSKKFNKNSANFFLKYLIAIAVHTHSVLPILCQVAKQHKVGSDLKIDPVLKQAIKFQRSDAICWSLYFMGICGQKLSDEFAEDILATKDCMSIGMLIALNQHKDKVIDFVDNAVDSDSEYTCDQYWILLHELAPDCPKFNQYRGQSGLKFLREKNVRFIKPMETET